MLDLTNKVIAVDICNTIADVNRELTVRLGFNPNPTVYFHPALKNKPNYFEDNLDIFLKAKPIGVSAQVLRELSKHNKIVYITARPKVAEEVTKLWLAKKGYPISDIYFTNNKVEIASKLGVDLAIDDAPYEIERYIEAGIDVLVKKQDYNFRYENRFEWANL